VDLEVEALEEVLVVVLEVVLEVVVVFHHQRRYCSLFLHQSNICVCLYVFILQIVLTLLNIYQFSLHGDRGINVVIFVVFIFTISFLTSFYFITVITYFPKLTCLWFIISTQEISYNFRYTI